MLKIRVVRWSFLPSILLCGTNNRSWIFGWKRDCIFRTASLHLVVQNIFRSLYCAKLCAYTLILFSHFPCHEEFNYPLLLILNFSNWFENGSLCTQFSWMFSRSSSLIWMSLSKPYSTNMEMIANLNWYQRNDKLKHTHTQRCGKNLLSYFFMYDRTFAYVFLVNFITLSVQ